MPQSLPAALEIVPPGLPLTGKMPVPGSKSITNRVLLLASLADGTSRITGALKSRDTELMAAALRLMGVVVEEPSATEFVVTSTGRLMAPGEPLFLGNAGTATRFLTAAAAVAEGRVVVDGDDHMRQRPIGPLVEALAGIGVDITAPTACPPVTIEGRGALPAGRIEIDGGLSSQYVSALLMAAPIAEGLVEVALTGSDIGARGYVDLTIAAMRAFGAEIEDRGDGSWRIAPTRYRATDFAVEPDASAATYPWAAERITGGRIDIGADASAFNQPDAAAHAVMAQFPHMPAEIDGSQMQDAVPALAVLAAFNETPVRFTGIANLRVKECDRVRAIATELSRILPGLGTEEGDDLLVASDPRLGETLAGRNATTRIETYADHRIAMAFALMGLRIPGIVILDPACAGKTWPGYWSGLEALGVRLEPRS